MENASKALLIAGSILVVILLIAMGVRVFNSTSGTTDSVEGTMQTTEITMFNNKFIQYAGKELSASQAYSLCNTVQASNATTVHQIDLYAVINGSTIKWGNGTFTFDYSKKYKAGMDVSSDGYINKITIRPVS